MEVVLVLLVVVGVESVVDDELGAVVVDDVVVTEPATPVVDVSEPPRFAATATPAPIMSNTPTPIRAGSRRRRPPPPPPEDALNGA